MTPRWTIPGTARDNFQDVPKEHGLFTDCYTEDWSIGGSANDKSAQVNRHPSHTFQGNVSCLRTCKTFPVTELKDNALGLKLFVCCNLIFEKSILHILKAADCWGGLGIWLGCLLGEVFWARLSRPAWGGGGGDWGREEWDSLLRLLPLWPSSG